MGDPNRSRIRRRHAGIVVRANSTNCSDQEPDGAAAERWDTPDRHLPQRTAAGERAMTATIPNTKKKKI
jgi:hypothetical protein